MGDMVGATPTSATRFIEVWCSGCTEVSETFGFGSIPNTSANLWRTLNNTAAHIILAENMENK